MASPQRPPIQHCPVCRIAMVGSKSHESHPHFDVFLCLTCGAVVRFAPPPPAKPKPDE
jgi:hypothetical protein